MTQMRSLLLLSGLCAILLAPAAARAVVGDQRPQLLVQARAADALGEVLTRATARADAQVNQLRAMAGPTAPNAAAPRQPAPAAAPAAGAKPPTYRELFDRAVNQIRRDGLHTTDPSFDNLTDADLFREMTSLQLYNLRQFVRLNQLRAECDALRARLQSAGKWSGPATTQPAIDTPDTLAAAVQARLQKGERDPQWEETRDRIHDALAGRESAAPQQPYDVPQGAPAAAGGVAAAPPADDPRFQPYYYGPQDANTGWNDPSNDSFTVQGGGGVYHRSDTRVNRFNDVRTNSTYDRRVNVDADRRLNIHRDPRENF